MELDGVEGFAPLGSHGCDWALPSSSGEGWEAAALAPLFLASEEHGKGWEMVVPRRGFAGYDDGCSVFPPCEHEGLRVDESFVAAAAGGQCGGSDPASAPSSPPFSSSSSPCPSFSSSSSRSFSFSPFVSSAAELSEAWPAVRCNWARKSFMEWAKRAVRSGYEILYLTLRRPTVGRGLDGVKRGAVWSSAAVAGLAILLLLSIRRRYQRERLRLLFLIQEKDQRISQLLLQIAQMNEILSSRGKVPIVKAT